MGDEAAPGPIAWISYEAALYWIGVHVVEFLAEFFGAVDIEIVETGLPEIWSFCIFTSQVAGDSLLHDFQD